MNDASCQNCECVFRRYGFFCTELNLSLAYVCSVFVEFSVARCVAFDVAAFVVFWPSINRYNDADFYKIYVSLTRL